MFNTSSGKEKPTLKEYCCRDCDFTSKSRLRAGLHTLSKNWYKVLWPVYTNSHRVEAFDNQDEQEK
jgi:hypothetical protein